MQTQLTPTNAERACVRNLQVGDRIALDALPATPRLVLGFSPCQRTGVRRIRFADGSAHTIRENRPVWRLAPADLLVWPIPR